jgi:O-antigen/teichoic acid export membrane protein
VLVLDLQRRLIRYAGIAFVFNVVANLLVIPDHGFVGAAWVTLATEILILGLSGRMVMQKLGFGLRTSRILRAALAAAAMGLAIYGLREAGLPLGGLIAVAAALYPGLLLASGALKLRELRLLVRKEGT